MLAILVVLAALAALTTLLAALARLLTAALLLLARLLAAALLPAALLTTLLAALLLLTRTLIRILVLAHLASFRCWCRSKFIFDAPRPNAWDNVPHPAWFRGVGFVIAPEPRAILANSLVNVTTTEGPTDMGRYLLLWLLGIPLPLLLLIWVFGGLH